MYTVVSRTDVNEPRPKTGERPPEVIDHRKTAPLKWKDRKRHEQLPYETLKEHRDTLLESEIQYKKRIKELEAESEKLVKLYEDSYQQSKQYKSIIEHGPDAVKLKQLNKDKRQQKGLIEQLEEDNAALKEKLNELEKKSGGPTDSDYQNDWDKVLEKARMKRAEEDAIPTQGPFAAGKLVKHRRVTLADNPNQDQDAYDLELDTLEKETQIILNKLKQLKREKYQIDWATSMGKGAVTRNSAVANAINEKLNRDLNKYRIHLEKMKIKHGAAHTYHELATNVVFQKGPPEILEYIESARIKHQKALTEYQQQQAVKKRSPQFQKEVSTSAPQSQHGKANNIPVKNANGKLVTTIRNSPEMLYPPNPAKEEVVSNQNAAKKYTNGKSNETKSNKYKNMDNVNNQTDSPRNQQYKSKSPAGTYKVRSSSNPKEINGHTNNEATTYKPRSSSNPKEMNGHTHNEAVSNRIKASSVPRGINGHADKYGAQTNNVKASSCPPDKRTKSPRKPGSLSDTVGRYTNGPEPIERKRVDKSKVKNGVDGPVEEHKNGHKASKAVSIKSPRTSRKRPSIITNSNDNNDKPDDEYDSVLAYLKKQQTRGASPVKFKSDYAERRQKHVESPEHIDFKANGQLLDQDEVRLVMGNAGIRRTNYYQTYNYS